MNHLQPLLASAIVAGARAFLGAPWRHRGRTRRGVDCLGLILLALQSAGWTPKHPGAVARLDYDRLSGSNELREVLGGEGDLVSQGDKAPEHLRAAIRTGDVLTFVFPGHAWTQHVGLATGLLDGVPTFIHARATGERDSSRVVEHTLADGWLEGLCEVYRIEGVVQDG